MTFAEAVGLLAPTVAGIVSYRAGIEGMGQVVMLVVAGAFEGLCLGFGQAVALALPLARARYAGLTALGASLVWALVTPPVPLMVLWSCGGILMAFVMALVTWQGARRLIVRSPPRLR